MTNKIVSRMQQYGQESTYTRQIAQLLTAEKNFKIITEKNCQNHSWQLTFNEDDQELVTIICNTIEEGLLILRNWIQYIYPLSKSSFFQATIIKNQNHFHGMWKKNNRPLKIHSAMDEIELYRKMKKDLLELLLVQVPIKFLLTPGDLSPLGHMAFECFLLQGDNIQIEKTEGKIETTIKTSRNQEFSVIMRLLNPVEFPKLWNCLEEKEYQLRIQETNDFLFQTKLVHLKTQEVKEIVTGANILETLKNLELELQKSMSKKRRIINE